MVLTRKVSKITVAVCLKKNCHKKNTYFIPFRCLNSYIHEDNIIENVPRGIGIKTRFRGLLSGITKNEGYLYYSDNLNMKSAGDAAADSKYIWKAVEKGRLPEESAEDIYRYLNHISRNAKAFIYSNKIWGREATIRSLNHWGSTDGNFVLLSGGPSVGKSLLLRNLSNFYIPDQRVFININGRKT